jgi:hypothetical protein
MTLPGVQQRLVQLKLINEISSLLDAGLPVDPMEIPAPPRLDDMSEAPASS